MQTNIKYMLAGGAAVLAIVGTAVGASYATRESLTAPEPMAQAAPAPVQQTRVVHHNPQRQQVAQAAPRPTCNDHNIVGTGLGAVAGGVLGNQFGKGTGKTVATVGGAAAGGYVGNEYIPTRGATCD